MTSLADILTEHARRVDYNHPGYGKCRCGFDPEGWTEDGTDEGVDNPSWAEHVVEMVTGAGLITIQLDPEDLWDAHQYVLDWRDSDNCDDRPEHRERLKQLAARLRDAANSVALAAEGVKEEQ